MKHTRSAFAKFKNSGSLSTLGAGKVYRPEDDDGDCDMSFPSNADRVVTRDMPEWAKELALRSVSKFMGAFLDTLVDEEIIDKEEIEGLLIETFEKDPLTYEEKYENSKQDFSFMNSKGEEVLSR